MHCGHLLSLLRQTWARKLKQDLQNIWLPGQSSQRDNTCLKHKLPQSSLSCLLTKQISLCRTIKQLNIMAPNHLWGNWAKAPLQQPLGIFKICRGCTNCSGDRCNQVLVSVSAVHQNFWPDFWPDLDKQDGLHLSLQIVCTSWAALTLSHMPLSAVLGYPSFDDLSLHIQGHLQIKQKQIIG